MKLAEALLERKNIKQRIDALAQRLYEDAKVQEGDKPAGDPVETLREIDQLIEAFRELVVRINKTNAEAAMPDGRTIMEAIAERDMLNLKYGILARLASAAVASKDRFSRNEIRYVPTVDVAEIRKMADQTAKEMRELDAQIQAANWNVELL
jgi:hypothetical protein